MTSRNKEFKSTQKSFVTKSESKNYRYSKSFYGRMFLKDLCTNFSIHFSGFAKPNKFFTTSSNDSNLGEYLERDDYGLSNILSQSMYNLLINGVSYIEIVLGFEDGELISISFVPLSITKYAKRKGEIRFFAKDAYNGKPVDWTITNNFLIRLDLKDLGMRRNRFRKILKGLSKKDIPNFDWLAKTGISLYEYANKQILHSMKIVGNTYWDLRKNDNEHISDVHLLYRKTMCDLFKFNFLEYMLAQYNKSLLSLGVAHGFEGVIAHTADISDHRAKLAQLLSGEVSCDNMCDYLFRRST